MTRAPLDAQALLSLAVTLAQKAGGPHAVTADSLEAALKSAPGVALTELPISLTTGLHDLEPLPRLVLCLHLLQSADGQSLEGPWLFVLGDLAVRAFHELGRPELFALRLSLIDRLLAAGPSPQHAAELHFQRGNTRLSLSDGEPALLESALQDLEAASEAARACGLTLGEIQAECLRAQAEWRPLPGRTPPSLDALARGLTRLHSLLERVRSEPGIEAGIADLHEALGDLENRRSIAGGSGARERAVHHMRQAAELTADIPTQAYRWATLAQLLLSTGASEEGATVVHQAEESLRRMPAGTSDLQVVQVHAILGNALRLHGKAAQALTHLEFALRLLAPRKPGINRNVLRLQTAQALSDVGRWGDARHQLELVFEDALALEDALSVRDSTRTLVKLDRDEGRWDAARERLRAAEARLPAGPSRTLLTLMRLDPAFTPGGPSEEFITFIRQYLAGQHPTDGHSNAQLERSIAFHIPALPSDVRRQLLAAGPRLLPDPGVRAVLLEAEGQREAARDLLRAVLASQEAPTVRRDAAALLIAFLTADAHEERLRVCQELETLLESPDGSSPSVRANLARALRRSARGDSGLLERAWRHTEQAAAVLKKGSAEDLFNTRTRCGIRMDQLTLHAGVSSPAAWTLAEWFLDSRGLPEAEVADNRRHAAWRILAPGPLTHPDGVALAERLLGTSPLGDEAKGLESRLQWIRACLATPETPPPRPTTVPAAYHGQFDLEPAWIVTLAQGDVSRWERVLGPEDLEHAIKVIQVRPDRAGVVLDRILVLDGESKHLEKLADLVSLLPREAPLAALREKVDRLAADTPSAGLLQLRVALHKGGDPEAYAQAVAALQSVARSADARVDAQLNKGIEYMSKGRFREARSVLEEALVEARRSQLDPWHLSQVLVLLGNALRKGPAPEVDRALSLYAEAEALGISDPQQSARRWKVTADALLERGKNEDVPRALELLERALAVRDSGYLRVETLLSAARAEQRRSDGDDLLRHLRALERLDEAERHAEGEYLKMIAHEQVGVLARIVGLRPQDASYKERLTLLGRQHPEFLEDTERAKHGVSGLLPDDEINLVKALMFHPAGRAYSAAVRILQPMDWKLMEEMARRMGTNPIEMRQRMEQQHQAEDRSPRAIRAEADRLNGVRDEKERPGSAVGRARLLSHLAALGLAQVDEVVGAALDAGRLLRHLPEEAVRLQLQLELCHVWAPVNHASHPVRDFQRAAELARAVLSASRPGGGLARHALQVLARATRYRTDGDISAHLREAEQLYEQAIAAYEAVGMRDVVSNLRVNLSELRTARGAGDTDEALREGVAAARAKVQYAGGPEQRAQARLDLAVSLTRLGTRDSSSKGRVLLLEARSEFEKLDRARLTLPWDRHTADNYRTICLADLALRDGRHEEAIASWRQRYDSLGADTPEDVRAYTAHNLADVLLHWGTRPIEWMEGLDLSERALVFRTLDRDAIHHWETCENIGRGAYRLLVSALETGLGEPAFMRRVWEQGRNRLRGAFDAARKQGSHERLFQSAVLLMELALVAPSLAAFERAAADGWSALDESRPYLLFKENTGAEEARLAAELAAALAQRYAARSGGERTAEQGFVLSDEQAESVLGWVVKATGAAQRRLAARTSRPEKLPPAVWVEWLTASRSGDERTIRRALDAVRSHVPDFLRGAPGLQGTREWLRSHPGSAAVALVRSSRTLLATVLLDDEQPRVFIANLGPAVPPHDTDAVARTLSAQGAGPEYVELLEWARRSIIHPLSRLMLQKPSQLLWVPSDVLRGLAPMDLWPGIPITCAVRLDLTTRSAPPRPRRTLLAVADPGPGSPRALPGSVELGASLAVQAQGLGPLRVRMSRGATWGRALSIPCPELVEGPASAEDLLRELAEVDVAMMLCHGEVDGPEDARLLLVERTGAVAPLTLQRLAEDPHLVAGATFVLLSCETGRVGPWRHRASGLAGALLAGGARNVIAPLWPVLLEPAWKVGLGVLEALAKQGDLSEALLGLSSPEQGPALGGRVLAADRQATQSWSLRAFARWVG
ncbi:CHAT domain-containing protein [Corallococcus sp. AB049A]|uniref:CHAT domain-containing protein n=1 Tax=Corallococcus sp. AB049A TaxID=2316721 RepID=UPI000ED9E28A|nr:CHAT domain-containing protein [Corallococcus sp. AB049A]RKI74386.1 CHAT domain-containing protein [Corallococcus sp. AB049A]